MDTKGIFKKGVNLLTLASFLLWNLAAANPEGGSVAQGSATISQSGAQTTVNQTSQAAVINWNSFNTASHEAVQFNQPNANAVALNRITNGLPTQFAGSLNANGQVWILNPAGVLFTSTAQIDVAGLVATTHGITDANFMSGNYKFDLVPGSESASIINNGLISAKDSGIVALVAPHVANNGLIQANLGKVSLSSGAAYTLDMYGDSLINFGSNAPINKGSVSNTGKIIADGGKVYMTANYAAGVLDNIISMTGTIQAKSVGVNKKGEIVLFGGNQQTKKLAGVTKVSGKLDTSGGAGFIETSGYDVDLKGADIKTGVGGTWLLDPPTIYTSTWGSLISDQLNAGTNVTLSTGVSGAGDGDIYLDAPITWGTSAQLMLGAYRNINISEPVLATNNGRFIARADLSANGTGTVNFSGSGSVTVDGANGYAKLFYNPTGGNYATPTNYSGFLSGTAPIKAGYMMINDQAQLLAAGAVGSPNTNYNYALNNDIDMTGVPLSSSIFFSPSGSHFKGNFEGHNYADGLNKTISNITFSTGGGGVGSLMTYIDGRIDNITLSNVSLTAGGNYGGLVWSNNGTISNVHVIGNLVGTATSGGGGIVGENQGVIKNSWFSGSVNSAGLLYIGGITGFMNTGASIIDSYNEGAITGSLAGGLVGLLIGVSTITNSYNVGLISGGGAALIGAANIGGATITGAYWNTATSGMGSPYAGPFAGSYSATALNDADMKIVANFPTFDFLNTWTTNGNTTYPQLITMPNDIIDSTQVAGSLGASAAGQTVNIFADNVLIGSAIADSNGVFRLDFEPNLIYVADPVMILATTSGAVTGDYLGKFYGPVGNLDIVNNQVTVRSDTGAVISNTDVASLANRVSYTNSGDDLFMNSGVSFLTTAGVVYSSVFTTPNTPYNLNGNLSTLSGGNVTYNGPVTVGPGDWTINSANNITFNSTVDDVLSNTNDLDLIAGGVITFADNVGVISPLDLLTVTAPIIRINPNSILTFSIITSGTQTYNGNVQLTLQFFPLPPLVPTNFLTSTAGDITLNGPVTLTNASGLLTLELNAANNVNINGNIFMNPTPASAINGGRLIVSAGNLININTPIIEAGSVPNAGFNLGSIFFNSPIILYQDLTTNTADFGGVRFNTVNGPYALIINTAAQVNFDADIGMIDPLSQLQVNGSGLVDINADNFMTVGDQLFNNSGTGFYPEPRVNNGNITFTSLTGTVIFKQGLLASLGQSLTINGNAELSGNFHGPFAFSSITINGNTTISNAGANLDSASTIALNGDVNSKLAESGSLTLNAPVSVQFSGNVNGVTPLAALNINSPHIILNGATINEASRIYSQSIEVTAAGGTLNASGLLQFDNVIEGPGSLTINDSLGTVAFNNLVGSSIALDNLYVTANQINMNTLGVTTDNNQVYTGPMTLFAGLSGTTMTSNNAGITFNGTVDSDSIGTPRSLNLSAGTAVEFNGVVGGTKLYLLSVLSGQTNINTTAISTTTLQNYQNIVLGSNTTLTADSQYIQFNGTIVGPAYDLAVIDAPTPFVSFNGDVDVRSLYVEFTDIYFNTANILTSGDQTYLGAISLLAPTVNVNSTSGNITFMSPGTIDGASALTVNAAGTVNFNGAVGGTPLTALDVTGSQINVNTSSIHTSGAQTYHSPVNLIINSVLTSDNNDITFNNTVEGPGGLIINVTNGTAFVNDHMGFGTPVDFLTINGTAQGVNVIAVGDIIMGPFNVVTNDLVHSLAGNVNFTGGPVTLFANLDVIAAEQIFFGAGANGVTGPFALSAQSLNPIYGPSGQGVTGTVNVTSFTLGGPGGGHLSQNYPTTESFVAGQGAGQAIMNTVISPDFSGSGAIYCVNNFCATIPVPPVNNPVFNVPPVEIFNIPTPVTCVDGVCNNLEMMIDNLVEAGVVTCGGSGEGGSACGFGFMQAQDTNGIVRILMPGDVVYVGDKIMKQENTCACVKSLYTNNKTCMGSKSLGQVYKN